MACRCSYCGKFCSRSGLHEGTGLCFPCKEKLHPAGSEPAGESQKEGGDEVEVDSHSDGGESVSSKAKGQEEALQVSEPNPQGSGASEEPADANICARCWKRPSTRALYNSPTCDECFKVAKEMKEGSRGTKGRFHPPTPLQPGKKLTRVCDSCRQKRKRCEHRRVVNCDDPAATDRRRKRARVEETIPEEDESEDASSTQPAKKRANSFSNSADPAVENSAVSSCGSAEENLQWAIKQSVETVYRREHERLLGLYDAKMVEANEAFAAVKRHMNQWLYEVSKPRASSS